MASAEFPFPSINATPEEKSKKDWGLKYLNAALQQQMTDPTYVERINRYKDNSRYAEGLESIEKYKDLLSIKDSSYLNLDFSNVSVIPVVVNRMVDITLNQPQKLQVDAMDKISRTKKEEQENKLYANLILKDISEETEKITGVPLIPKGEYIPEDEEDIKLRMGLTWKSKEAMDMQALIDAIMLNNAFEDIKRKIVRDFIVNKIACLRVYYDANHAIKVRVADIVNCGYSWTDRDDFSNINHAWEVYKMSINELSDYCNSGKDANDPNYLKEADLLAIAKNYAGIKYGNPEWNAQWGVDSYYPANSSASRPWGSFLVNVMDAEIYTVDRVKWVEKEMNDGKVFMKRVPSSYAPVNTSKYKKKVVEKTIQKTYCGKWVVGTEYLFDYGPQFNQRRKRINGSYAPTIEKGFIFLAPNIYDMENKSDVERMRPFKDQIQLAHLKMQQFVSKIRPSGIAIDVSGLENVVVGMGAGMDPKKIVEMYEQTGNQLFNSQRSDGSIINGKPIDQLDNGIQQMAAGIQSLIAAYEYNMNKIREVSGITPAVDGSIPSKESLPGIAKLQVMASNTALRNINASYVSIIEKMASQVAIMIQDSIEHNNETFVNLVGKGVVDTIKKETNLTLSEFNISIRFLPNEEQKARMQAKIDTAVASGEIPIDAATYIESIDDPKLQAAVLKKERQRYMQEKQNINLQNTQANADAQVQSAMVSEEEKRKTIMAKAEADIAVMREKYKFEIEMKKIDSQNKITHEVLKGKIEEQAILTEHELEIEKNNEADSAAGVII